ncbi:sugar phosphate isomerase/epimerase family protein [Clostridium grantii]|uniref:Sugar phosphate isomerase/epimerase n=1 Tax=Clostridium grantii DSM 8605 TaxID=1121316 RepID=A0A1M5SUS4_9CLOT|nr:sugar phosphate isomerase/epimerase family protein [Clostridium grantii]SHH42311.1 Sugar phosphate isomerase/epimerase [Clostridium grantii DSM 8605]
MKSNFKISGFSDEIDSDFQVQLSEIKALEIEYIEIRGVNGKSIVEHTIEEVKDIKKALDKACIKVSAIASPIGKINIEDDFEPHYELFKHTIEICKILNTKYIRLFSFFMESTEAEMHRDEVMRRLKIFKDYVEGTDIILLHENEKEIYGESPERCLDIVNTIGSPNFKLIFDPANFVQCKVESYPYAFELLKDEVIYYHIKDALSDSGQVVVPGNGNAEIKSILTRLKERQYEGFLSLEPHLGYFEGFNDLEGENHIPEFKEKSDASKFKQAAQSLKKILLEVENG